MRAVWPFFANTAVAFSTPLAPQVVLGTLAGSVPRFTLLREAVTGRVGPTGVVLCRHRPWFWSPCAPVFRGRLHAVGSGSRLEGTFSPTLFGVLYAFFPFPFIFAFSILAAATPPEQVHPSKLFLLGGLLLLSAFWLALLAAARWAVRNDITVISTFIESTLNARGA